MAKKDQEWRVHVRLPEDLKPRYAEVCRVLGRTMSEDIRSHIERAVEAKEGAEKEPAS